MLQISWLWKSGGSPRLIIKVPVSSSNHKIRSNTVWFGCLHYFHDVFSRVFLDCLSVGFVISLDYIEVWNSYIEFGWFSKKLDLFILSKITLLARLVKSSQLLEEINASLLTFSQADCIVASAHALICAVGTYVPKPARRQGLQAFS